MIGYFGPNFKTENQELHPLELSDCDFIDDDEDTKNIISIFGRNHACPRCGSITRISGEDPYCADCNWDSLTGAYNENKSCAA